jgi:hypothetical protein
MSKQNQNQTTPAPAGWIYAYAEYEERIRAIRAIEAMRNISVRRMYSRRSGLEWGYE